MRFVVNFVVLRAIMLEADDSINERKIASIVRLYS
jgi:hypothetical protein